jgi:ABC-type proline/glycine betaine transport system substrate-binding protein
MEYEVETKLTDVENAYKEISEGTSDVFPDTWLP